MSQLTPAAIKPHLAIAAGDTGDDELITSYIEAAEAHVAKHLRRDLDAEFPEGWPKPILQAARLLIGHWYANREAVVVGTIASEIPLGTKALLAPWRNLAG